MELYVYSVVNMNQYNEPICLDVYDIYDNVMYFNMKYSYKEFSAIITQAISQLACKGIFIVDDSGKSPLISIEHEFCGYMKLDTNILIDAKNHYEFFTLCFVEYVNYMNAFKGKPNDGCAVSLQRWADMLGVDIGNVKYILYKMNSHELLYCKIGNYKDERITKYWTRYNIKDWIKHDCDRLELYYNREPHLEYSDDGIYFNMDGCCYDVQMIMYRLTEGRIEEQDYVYWKLFGNGDWRIEQRLLESGVEYYS